MNLFAVFGSKEMLIYDVAEVQNTDADPKLIEVPETVPTIAVPLFPLPPSRYAMTILFAVFGSKEVEVLSASADSKTYSEP